jgi:adenosylcobyric acid synthase
VQFGAVNGAWSKLARLGFQGYEIHQGQTHLINAKQEAHECVQRAPDTPDNHAHTREVINGLAWQNASGNVLGLYVHGLFEAHSVLCALFGSQARTLDTVFDGLADCLERNSTPGFLQALIAD